MAPMAEKGDEPRGSMGTDTPLAVLSDRPQLLFNYFKQHFAQVTNPAIDPIREELVMSLKAYIGGEGNFLFELPDQAQMLELPHPILTNSDLAKLRETHLQQVRMPPTIPMLYPVDEGGEGLKAAIDELCRQASLAVLNGYGLVILSDRGSNEKMAPVPSLLGDGRGAPSPDAQRHAHEDRHHRRDRRRARGASLRPACSVTARARSILTWRSRPSTKWCATGRSRRSRIRN